MSRLLRYVIAFVLLVFISFFLYRDYAEVFGRFSFRAADFFLITILHILFLLVSAKRFLLVVLVGSNNIKFSNWFVWFIEAKLLNKLFPQLGNIYRGVKLKQNYGVSYSSYSASYIFFTWVDTVTNFLFASVAILLVSTVDGVSRNIEFLVFLFLFVSITLPLWVYPSRSLSRLMGDKVQEIVHSVSGRLLTLTREFFTRRIFIKLLFLGVLGFVLMALRIGVAFSVFGVNLTVADLFVLYAFYKLSTMVVITPGNIGVQELSMASIGLMMGYDFALGLSASILLRLYGYALFLSLWLAFNVKSRLGATSRDS